MSIALDTLNAASAADFLAALGGIYEHSPWVVEAIAAIRPFPTVAALHDATAATIRAASTDRKLALLRAHPDLAGKAARAGDMTRESVNEQAGAGLDRLSEAEYARFHRLNDAYRVKFGFPFIVCARRHAKDSILDQFERRLGNDATTEIDTALREIAFISRLRLCDLVDGRGKPQVDGRLSTHVLDTHLGRPAPGVRIELLMLQNDGREIPLADIETNADGRTDKPLIGGQPLRVGRYELRFHVGAYFARRAVPAGDPAFLDIVPLRFGIAEPEGHYHVPLLATPWSYSTYRGS